MPFLVSGAERAPLRIGSNRLGGRGADAVVLTSLAALQPAAVLTVSPDGSAELQRLAAAVVVKVDEEPLGAEPHALRHGARLAIGPVRLMYADPSAERNRGQGATDPSEEATELVPAVPAAANSGRLIELATGRAFPIPPGGLTIGRGGACDVVIEGKGISRRHAVIKPDGPAFTISDESANGTYVNGAHVDGVRVLGQDDVIRIATHEFRLDVDSVLPVAGGAAPNATELLAGVPDSVAKGHGLRRPASANAPPAGPPAKPLALLEVTRGANARKLIRVERAACAIGRSEQNDVRLADNSVSTLHATLVLKRGTWYVVDLQSANGTYVDGYRVAGERALPDGATLRIGDVAMTFRMLAAAREKSNATQPPGGILRRLSKLWQS
jgi:pSer/pThr/pTyr-binding forkhead associated (FHA) protein